MVSKAINKKGRADAVISFIEKLVVPTGHGQGKPFKLLDFEKEFIRAVYEPHYELKKGREKRKLLRLVRRAILSVARKNGKSSLIAALAIVHLVGPEQIPNGEIYSAATEREQAAIVFKVAAQIVRADSDLLDRIKIIDSTKTMYCIENGSVYRATSAEANSKYGFNPSVVIYDELSQARNRDLYDAFDTSMGAREEPLFIIISTQSNDPQHVLSLLIDDGLNANDPTTIVHLHTTPDNVDPFDEKNWPVSNPALNVFRSMEDMRAMAAKAQRMPSFENTFRNLYLNQRVDAKGPLIPRAEWEACASSEGIELKEEVYMALDLSSTTDLCAVVMMSAHKGDRLRSWFWKPKDSLKKHEEKDRVPYTTWEKLGYLTAPEGRSVDYGHIAKKIVELNNDYRILGIAYDRWRIEILLKELVAVGLNVVVEGKDVKQGDYIPEDVLRLVPWGQGFRDMAPSVDGMETSILERRFKHDNNPVLTWCFSNAQAISDPAGNRKLDKSKTRFRIDGAVATAMCIGLKLRDAKAEEEVSVYESRGVFTFGGRA